MRDGPLGRFVPMLDREILLEDPDGGLFHDDGTPVAPERLEDVVYVNASEARRRVEASATGWWRAIDRGGPASQEGDPLTSDVRVGEVVFTPNDVSAMLVAVASAHDPGDPIGLVDAGFFHRTLVRWMGLDDDDAPSVAPRWDYRFWKAQLHLEGKLDRATHALARGVEAGGTGEVRAWTAEVWRGENAAPERYRYWVAFDDDGRVAESAWLSEAPDLLAATDDDDGGGFRQGGPDPDALEAALRDD